MSLSYADRFLRFRLSWATYRAAVPRAKECARAECRWQLMRLRAFAGRVL